MYLTTDFPTDFPCSNLAQSFSKSKNLNAGAAFCLATAFFATALACAPLAGQTYGSQYGFGYGYGRQTQSVAGQSLYSAPQVKQPQYAQPGYGAGQGFTQGSGQAYEQLYAPGGQQGMDYGAEEPAAPVQVPLSPDQLEQLVAPVALYPDALVAQILTASTYPAQVAVADQWLHQMQAQGYGSPEQIEAGANAQSWDPSVKVLTAFPQVMDMLNQNLQWTTELGDAYYNQPQDVMQTVQVMRQRAQEAGTLRNTPEETVTEDQGAIEVAPPNPNYVYVPTYDPWASYGDPVSPYPGFSVLSAMGSFFGGSPVQDAIGFAMSAFLHTPWGWLGWGLDWLSHVVLFEGNGYLTHSTSVADWGFPHGGPRAYEAWNRGASGRGYSGNGSGWERAGNGYDRGGRPWGSSPQPYARQPYVRDGQTWNRGGEAYARPAQPYGDSTFSRGYPVPEQRNAAPERNYARSAAPPQFAYSRPMPQVSRPQPYTYSRAGNGYGFAMQQGRAYVQPGGGYSSYRAPEWSFAGPSGRSFSQHSRSNGFHLFGGNREPRGFSSSVPKNSFGGGRSWSGGGGKAPKMSSGGHSSGGGKSNSGRRR